MISRLTLAGWKGQHATYDLSRPTLLCGRNGAGKSAVIDAITYVLTGTIRGGKALDHVAKWFGPQGGSVQLWDDRGHYVIRGIEIDAGKKRVSEVLTTSVLGLDEKPDWQYWASPAQVLDVLSFLALSSSAKREYLLALCGGGEATPNLVAEIALHYAREVAGPLAVAESLTRTDLPADVAPAALAWTRPRGIREVIEAVARGSKAETCSALALRMGDRAKEERLACARAARDARQAITELEGAAKGAEGAAQEFAAANARVLSLRAALDAKRQHNARVSEAQRVEFDLAGLLPRLVNAHERALALRAELPPLGERPVIGVLVPLDFAHVRLGAQVELSRLEADDKRLRELGAAIEQTTGRMEAAHAEGEALSSTAAIRARALLVAIPDDVHPQMPELRALVTELTRVTAASADRANQRVAALSVERAALAASRDELTQSEASRAAREQELCAEIERLAAQECEDVQRVKREREEWDSAMRAWQDLSERHTRAAQMVAEALHSLTHCQERLEAARSRVLELGPVQPIAGDEIDLARAEQSAEAARKAQASVDAHRAASARCEEQAAMEGHWKVAEGAIRAAREHLVSAAAAPLVARMDEVLEQLGREERAWVALENDRGTSICELGWSRNGTRANVASMSAGETVIFLAALTAALAAHTRGIRPLLVEADPLDAVNLRLVLAALPRIGTHFDAVVVATAQHVADSPLAGDWHRIDL